jgi:hypothetical protein
MAPHPASSKLNTNSPQVESVGMAGVGAIVVVAVDVLFAGVGSVTSEETVAVLEMLVPVANPEAVWTTREIVALPPFASVPRLQVTVVVPLHDPVEGVAETNVTPAGRVSDTLTPVAELGPALFTVIV